MSTSGPVCMTDIVIGGEIMGFWRGGIGMGDAIPSWPDCGCLSCISATGPLISGIEWRGAEWDPLFGIRIVVPGYSLPIAIPLVSIPMSAMESQVLGSIGGTSARMPGSGASVARA